MRVSGVIRNSEFPLSWVRETAWAVAFVLFCTHSNGIKTSDQTIFKVGNGAMSAPFPISPVMLEWDFRTPFLLRFFDTKSSFLCLSLSSLLARISRGGEKEHVRGNPRILDKIKVSRRRFDVYNTCRRLIKRSQWALMLWIPECKAAFRVPVFDFKAW